ncbi:MAG: hypothetical protein INR69_15155 [Mucilaginibacter polytrichastri]|nr:hypothetical protein [Mucilaginibacter polytrichastri]
MDRVNDEHIDVYTHNEGLFQSQIQAVIDDAERALNKGQHLMEHRASVQMAIRAIYARAAELNPDDDDGPDYDNYLVELGVLQGKISVRVTEKWA